LEGEDDVPIRGLLDQNKVSPSNQEIKALSLLFKGPRSMGEAVVGTKVPARTNPGKGHICWLIS